MAPCAMRHEFPPRAWVLGAAEALFGGTLSNITVRWAQDVGLGSAANEPAHH